MINLPEHITKNNANISIEIDCMSNNSHKTYHPIVDMFCNKCESFIVCHICHKC